MLIYLILLFTILPALELALLIKIGTLIGVIDTLLIIIFTGILGALLARYQGFIVLQKIQDNLNRGVMPSTELLDGLMILVGGIVLLTPGLITDFFGFLLLIPWSRAVIKYWVKHHFEESIKRGDRVNVAFFNNKNDRYDDIDI